MIWSCFAPLTWLAPYGLPPWLVVLSAGSLYEIPTITIPWCSSGVIMLVKVVSCPPCMVPVLVNTDAGLFCKSPASQIVTLLSQKYFIDAVILPKWVGLPNASPTQFFKSSMLAYRSPSSGILGATFSVSLLTLGTVRIRAAMPVPLSSIPCATRYAKSLVEPFWL